MRLGPVVQRVLRLGQPGLALRVVQGPFVEAHDGLPRLFRGLLAKLDGLGEDDLLLGSQQRDAGDLTQVQPDGIIDVRDVGIRGGRRLLVLVLVLVLFHRGELRCSRLDVVNGFRRDEFAGERDCAGRVIRE